MTYDDLITENLNTRQYLAERAREIRSQIRGTEGDTPDHRKSLKNGLKAESKRYPNLNVPFQIEARCEYLGVALANEANAEKKSPVESIKSGLFELNFLKSRLRDLEQYDEAI